MDNAPTLRTKLVFWTLLSFLSVGLAEIASGSSPFAFVNPVETIFLTFFYGSHLLVFAWLSFRRGWPSLTTLWLGGVLFGLYEFYVTKVMWSPPWGDTVSLAHVDVFALIVLAFFWHPFMSFIFPLAIAEGAGTRSRWVTTQLPEWFTGATKRTMFLAFVIAALTVGAVLVTPAIATVSVLSFVVVILATLQWWRRSGRHNAWDLRSLLPSDRQGKRLAAVLAAQYLVFAPLWNTESIPPLIGHVVVWLLYAGITLLFLSARSGSQVSVPPQTDPMMTWPRRKLIQWAGALLLLSALGSLGQPEIGALVIWIGSTITGLWMLVVMLRKAMARETPPSAHDGDPAHKSSPPDQRRQRSR